MNSVVRIAGADTTRRPSDSVWKQCPWAAIKAGLVNGVVFEEDFEAFPITPPTTEGNWGRYAMFSSTGGTAANLSVTEVGGVLAIGSDGDNEGCSFRTVSTPFLISRDYSDLWYEIRLKTSTIADTKHGIFAGLIEDVAFTATVPIAAAGTLSDNNFVGFHRLEGDGDYFDTVYKANGVTQVTVQSDACLLVADTYTKLGMRFTKINDQAGAFRLSFYQDGVRLSTSYQIPSAAGTDFPNDVSLGIAVAVLNATGTTPGTTSIDWIRAAQLFS